jgi:hypothetical protein
VGHDLRAYEVLVELWAQFLGLLTSGFQALLSDFVVQLQELVAGLIAYRRLGDRDALSAVLTRRGAQLLPRRGLIAILRRCPSLLTRLTWLGAARLSGSVTRLRCSRLRCSRLRYSRARCRQILSGAGRSAESLRRPAACAAPLLELLHKVAMVALDHFTKLLDLFVLRGLLTELRKRDLLVVVDDQQGDDAWFELLGLQAGAANLAWLSWLSELTGLSGLSRLAWPRLAGAWLGWLRLR